MTEKFVEQGIETAKTEGLLAAVTEVKNADDINGVSEQSVIDEIVLQAIEDKVFSDELIRDARRAAVLGRISVKHHRKARGR